MSLINRPNAHSGPITTVAKPTGKLTPAEVLAIRADPASQSAIAERYDISQGLVSHIKTRKVYAWVSGPDSVRPAHVGQFMSRLSDADVRAIRESRDTHRATAERYGVSPGYIADLRRGAYREFAGGPIGIRRRPQPITDAKALEVFADALALTKRHNISMKTLRFITHSRFYTTPKAAREEVLRAAA